jgi:predicted NUDIX family NTP pyrophosphohydrolase
MSKQSAGILLYRVNSQQQIEVLIVHPGGPFWKNKDLGAWSIPKGEFLPGEDPLEVAKREFHEEVGQKISGTFRELRPARQAGGKIVYCFTQERDIDVSNIKSNTFSMEWPPRSGRQQEFPEVDRAEWFDIETARTKLNASQAAFLDQLSEPPA